jgi:hypothetical protein
MDQVVTICKKSGITHNNLSHSKTLIELFKNLKQKYFYEVGTSIGYYSLLAGLMGWKVTCFEMNPDWYNRLCIHIHDHQMTEKITPIYTEIMMKPSLDHFIYQQTTKGGIVQINTQRNLVEILEGLKYSLQNQLIDGLIITIVLKIRPTNQWLEILMKIQKYNYTIFDLTVPQKVNDIVKLVPFNLETIHYLNNTTLLFLKNQLVSLGSF